MSHNIEADDSVRQFFKDVVAEAKLPSSQRGHTTPTGVLHSCSISPTHPSLKLYTDQYIDSLSPIDCKRHLTLFLVYCYRQK